jgi:hypothetical protein
MVKREELIGITDYLTLWDRCRINPCLCNRVLLYLLWRCGLENFSAFISRFLIFP